ncbi:hypothetical protein G9A89_015668 [Geosiphon pyriformis]|nr:hypothetical protein G9A89_015668 [Geosiphon pyriformis]
MPKHMHNINVEFDLKYPRKETIKLKPYLCTCINLKVALEISATTIVQLAFRNSLAKKRINIKGGIIDTRYIGNIIAMLQNDSEKTYIIESNEKIAQAIFLLLVKIAQLVSVEKKEELRITTRKISEFGSMSRINIPYMLAIEKRVKNQVQIFEAETTMCESGKIGFNNLYIPAKSPKHIKISIYNTTGDVFKIPKETTIRYLSTEVEEQLPNLISDFLQLCEYVNIISQIIYEQSKYYLLQTKQLEQMNLKNLDSLQQMQFKILLNNFNDIFASKNKFGRTDII